MRERRWWHVSGAWLGIGTSPGSLLLGALIAARHSGPVPLLSILLSFGLMFAILWFQGLLGLTPPYGEGENLTTLTPKYFGSLMQRVLGGVIAIGMLGWSGFNLALGGAALGRLLKLPVWAGALAIGLPVLILSLRGIRSWNSLAALATISVLVLTAFVTLNLAARTFPITLALGDPTKMVTDVAVMVGYVSVFSVRSPDFTAGLKRPRDLATLVLLLCVPVLSIALAGVGLEMGTGETDLVAVLARQGDLGIGNLLIFLSVIAPTFTTLYSGAPALEAAIGLDHRKGMIGISAIGFILAVLRFDLWLGGWLSVLAAMLPPLVVPLAIESSARRRNRSPRRIPIWTWGPGSLTAVLLTIAGEPLAPLIGLGLALVVSAAWLLFSRPGPTNQSVIS